MKRSRRISPSTRQVQSKKYRVCFAGISTDDILEVTITHSEIPSFKEVHKFEGEDLQKRDSDSIHFMWDGTKVFWSGNVVPFSIESY